MAEKQGVPEGFEEVLQITSKTLEKGEQVEGIWRGFEQRESVNDRTGELKPYRIYMLEIEKGEIRGVGGAKILDSIVDAQTPELIAAESLQSIATSLALQSEALGSLAVSFKKQSDMAIKLFNVLAKEQFAIDLSKVN